MQRLLGFSQCNILQAPKAISRIIAMFILVSAQTHAQRLSLNELILLCKKQNWEEVNQSMMAKGWTFYDSKKGDDLRYHQIQWSFEKDVWSEKAQGWFSLYCFEGYPNKVQYTVFNKQSYTLIQNALSSAGFKLVENEIEDGVLLAKYANADYLVSISTERRQRDDYEETSMTAYQVSIVKKASEYDPDNGKKVYYYDNGTIQMEATLLNGQFHGLVKSYYENGNLMREGSFLNGVENGNFKEYHESGNLSSVYVMKQGKLEGQFRSYHENGQLNHEGTYQAGKANGVFKEYKENGELMAFYTLKNDKKHGKAILYMPGNKVSEEITYQDDVKSGAYADYYYDEETGQLAYKEVGFYKNDEKDGKWETIVIEMGNEQVHSYVTYVNGTKEGPFKEFSGDTLIISSIVNGELHGALSYYVNLSASEEGKWLLADTTKLNKVMQAEFKQGELHGTFRALDISCNELTIGNYIEGNMQGTWSYFYFPSNDVRDPLLATTLLAIKANYKNGSLHGAYEQFFELNEACFETKFDRNQAKCSANDGQSLLYTASYKEGKLDGPIKKVDASGRILMQGQYKNDLAEGPWMLRMEKNQDNQAQPMYLRGSFEAGKRTGNWEQVDDNEKVHATGSYYNGELHGTATVWKAPGHPILKKTFLFGQIKSLIRYDELGMQEILKYEVLDKRENGIQFRKTVRDEELITSHEFWMPFVGNLEHEEFEALLDNATERKPEIAILNGKSEIKDINGKRIWTGTSKENQMVGTWVLTDNDQKVIIEQMYSGGELISERYLNFGGKAFTGLYIYQDFKAVTKELREIKNGLRHGKTTYVEPNTGRLLRKETYKRGELKK